MLKYFNCLIGAGGKWSLFFFPISLLPLQILFSFSTTVHSHTSFFFFYSSFIEIKVTDPSVHSFKAHSLMTMHRIVHLSSQYISGHIVTPRRKPRCFQPLPPNLGHALAQAATNLLSVSTRWPLLDISYERDPTAHGPLWLASFKERHSFAVQPPAHCVFLKRFQRQDTCVYRHTFEHGWLSWICLCSHCHEWQCCVLGDTHTHTRTHPYSYP